MLKRPGEAILFEMLRSFTTLARTLNLSRTVNITGATRQTVRRHIDILEENKGEKLFELVDRQYVLTEAGQRSLREAEVLLARGEAWLRNQTANVDGLYHIDYTPEPNFWYHLQQHRFTRLWTDGTPLLQAGFQAWSNAQGQIEHPAFQAIRPYAVVFRRREDDWLCVEIGQHSAFATWFGWQWERSSIGRGLADLPGGSGFALVSTKPYRDVAESGAPLLEHIHTALAQEPDGPLIPISYQRLLLASTFPDQSLALVSIVHRTYDLDIVSVTDDEVRRMPEDKVMDIDVSELQ
jgi:hypothetical protein